MRFRLEVLQLFPRGGDLLFEGGDVADLGQSVVEKFLGPRPLFLGSLLGAPVLVALSFELGQRQGAELGSPNRVDAAADVVQLARQILDQLSKRRPLVSGRGAALGLHLRESGTRS